MTLETILSAINQAGYSDMVADKSDESVTVSIIDTEANECLAAIRKNLPEGAQADFTGSSNTDGDGDTTEDIRIEWAA
jgi:hypothetical protein